VGGEALYVVLLVLLLVCLRTGCGLGGAGWTLLKSVNLDLSNGLISLFVASLTTYMGMQVRTTSQVLLFINVGRV
jgi:predicted transporter